MKTWQIVIVSLLAGLLSSGIILLIAASPRGEAVQLTPPPPFSPLSVDSKNEISNFILDDQPTGRLNFLQSGKHIDVIGQEVPETAESSNTSLVPDRREPEVIYPININTATYPMLEALPGIGVVRAKAIVNYRQTYGRFLSIDDIQLVPGIGPGIFESLKNLVTVGDVPY